MIFVPHFYLIDWTYLIRFFFYKVLSIDLAPLSERPTSANPGLKFSSVFVFFFPMYCLESHFLLSLLYLGVKAQQYFVSWSCMFLDQKTLFKIWLNPGLNLSIFRGTGPRFWGDFIIA